LIRKIWILFSSFLICLLFACNNTDNKPITSDTDNEPITSDVTSTFTGTITEIYDQTALVHIDEGEITKSGSRVHVDLSKNSETTFHVGDKVKVGYDGEVRESDPLQINVVFIEKVE